MCLYASSEEEGSKKSEYLNDKFKQVQLLLVLMPTEDSCHHALLCT